MGGSCHYLLSTAACYAVFTVPCLQFHSRLREALAMCAVPSATNFGCVVPKSRPTEVAT